MTTSTADGSEHSFGPSTIGIFVFPPYDKAIGRATRSNRTGGERMAPVFWAAGLGVVLLAAAPAMADEAPKYGGILPSWTPAAAPPTFDPPREGPFATVHSAAPFNRVLTRVNPNNPSSTT